MYFQLNSLIHPLTNLILFPVVIIKRVKKGGWLKQPSKKFCKFQKGKKNNKHKKSKSKGQRSGKGKKPFECHRYGGPNHIAKKCNIPQHLVDFNVASNATTTLGKIHDEAEKPSLMSEDYMDMENTVVEYNLNDVFGDLE
jgi:hypothetical protein